ncbi:hypothetical protein BGX30_004846, partial [Mortierella sp. GBA39]
SSEFNMPETPLSKYLDVNVQMIKEMTGDSSDIIIRRLDQALGKPVHVAVIYTDGLADEQIINNSILKSLTQIQADADCSLDPPKQVLGWIKHRFLAIGQVTDIDTMKKLFDAILAGNTVILVDGTAKGISASSAGGEQRGVDEPQSQTVIRGPREGFTENLRINTSLIRRKIKNPNLWIVDRTIGRVTQTNVAVMYIHGIASDNVVQEILKRLDRIDIDSVLESGYIEEFIQDATFTPFPTLTNSERPDAIAGAILEGKVAILVDGSPFVLIAPITIFKLFQSSEDYYQKFDIATFLRLMRIIAFVFSMLLPSMYIAITTFHQQMLPTTLLISLAAQREGVPFPAFVEALAMEITFEVLREAGVRMPRAIGSAISIVGALVLGQAAVQAGLVSAAMVIIVAFTAIAGFVAPSVSLSNSARLLRFGFMLLAATLGLFGIIAGLMAMLIHLSGLRSFGVPSNEEVEKMLRRLGLMFLLLSVALLTGGCWDSQELNTLSIISATSIDRSNGKWEISFQVVIPQSIATQTGGGGAGSQSPTTIFSTKGRSIAEAMQNASLETSRKLFFAHNSVLILSEDVARKEGVGEILDFFLRPFESRETMSVLLTKGKASNLLEVLIPLEKISGNAIQRIIDQSQKNLSQAQNMRLIDFARMVASPDESAMAPELEVSGDLTKQSSLDALKSTRNDAVIKLGELGVFRKDKLVGWIDQKDSRSVAWLSDRVSSMIVVFPKQIGGDVMATWSHLQEMNVDLAGFMNAIHRKDPSTWRNLMKTKRPIEEISLRVQVKINIEHTNMITKPYSSLLKDQKF